MPERWKDWILTSLPHLNRGTLQSVYDRLKDSPQSDTDIDRNQRTWLMLRIQQEIDFRNGADSQAHEPEPMAVLPASWRSWLQTVSSQNDNTLRSVIDNISNGDRDTIRDIDVAQRDFIISFLRNELNRRTETEPQQQFRVYSTQQADTSWVVSAADETAARNKVSQEQGVPLYTLTVSRDTTEPMTDQKYNVVVKDTGTVVLSFNAPDINFAKAHAQEWFTATHSDPDKYKVMLASLSSPDDEDINDIMGGDDEEPSTVPGEGTESFEIRNTHTDSVISVVRQGTLDYAVQKARQYEQDLGLSAGDLEVRRI